MVRVLQIRESRCDFETERGAASLARALGDGFEGRVKSVGPGGDFRGVFSAIKGIRREECDLVHAWGVKALICAALGAKGKIIYTPAPLPSLNALRWLRAVMEARDVQVVCPTAALRRWYVERGVPIEQCHEIRPGVEFGRVPKKRDLAMRKGLGFKETDYVILAAGESIREAAHHEALWGTATLNYLDPSYKLLIWGRGPQAQAIERFAKKICPDHVVVLAEQQLGRKVELEELLGAAEAVFVTARGPVPTLPIATCMAAGLPIISTVTETVAELLEDRHNCAMVTKPSPRLIAQRVLDVRNDAQLQWTISDMARTEAFEFFAMTRFVRQHRTLYRQWAEGELVTLPPEAPGAGQRFHALAT